MKFGWNWKRLLAVVAAVGLVAGALPQDYRQHRSDVNRKGRATVQPTTAAAETVWNNPGRAFLRWWDPIFQVGQEVDNDEPVITIAAGTWINPILPVGYQTRLATGFIQNNVVLPPYRFAQLSTNNTFDNPLLGASAVYEWQLNTLVPGQEYELYVNVPFGPTADTNGPAPATLFRFSQRYYVYQIIDNDPATPAVDIVDTFAFGNGYIPLGNGGAASAVRYTASGAGVIVIRLFNTVPRASQGGFLDPFANPGNEVVYADAVKAVASTTTRTGSYSASPVVGQLVNLAGGGASGGPYRQQVASARNESVTVGTSGTRYDLGVLTAFIGNGALANGAQPDRRNMLWSWPARRPFDLSVAEDNRYATERQAWINGGAALNPRSTVRRMVDNLNYGVQASGPFVNSSLPAFAAFNGPDYLISPVEPGTVPSGSALFRSDMPPGNYTVQVWMPTLDAITDLATTVRYEIIQGGNVIDTLTLNQSTGNGWVTLPNQPTQGYANLSSQDLQVRVLNNSTTPGDVGRQIFADAVRFVAQSDLSIKSTPAMVSATVRVGVTDATRDVVITAMEDGRIYCIDAHGDASGNPPTVYWVYPSENPLTDPNGVAAEDGIGNVATAPTRFNLSSALVVNTAVGDLLYIASENGRVYCLEMQGRGDGTTRRRWTWPDDYNPAAPTTPYAPPLGQISGSVTYSNVGPNGTILVPTDAGRLVALDALGNAATKTTTQSWVYPALPNPQLGPIEMTPVVEGNTVYFGAPSPVFPTNGEMHAVNIATGLTANANWPRTTRAGVGFFGIFGSCSPVYVPAALSGLPEDCIYWVDQQGWITCVEADGDAIVWEAQEATGGATGSLSFAYLRTYDTSPLPGPFLVDAVPSILVPCSNGQLMGFYAQGLVNAAGTRRNWRYELEGDVLVSSFATGSWPNAAGPLANRSHIYIGDSEGFLYAFSSEDDDNLVPPITPGVPPGRQQASDNDPTQQELNSVIDPNSIVVLSPDEYDTVFNQLQQGTLTYADVQAAYGNRINRRDFEFGETLYVMIFNLSDPTAPPVGNYIIEVQMSGTGRTAQRRQLPVRVVPGAPSPDDGGIVLVSMALTPTGAGGLVPGNNEFKIAAVARGVRSTQVNLTASPSTGTNPDFRIANPLAVRFPSSDGFFSVGQSQAGVTSNAALPVVRGNSPVGVDPATAGGPTPWRQNPGGFGGPLNVEPGGYFGTNVNATGDGVPHGSAGLTIMQVFDRSLMRLLLGPDKGLPNVRVATNDLEWQPRTDPTSWATDNTYPTMPVAVDPDSDLGVVKPLNQGTNKANWLYGAFEDYPWATPNRSLDYPDVNRSGLVMTKETFGNAENPLFNGVQLTPPSIDAGDEATYRTAAGYEAQMIRTLQPTPFDVQLNVPQFQPSNSTSYRGRQFVYVDSGQPGFQVEDTNRPFALGLRVGVDERMSTGTPVVDLTSQPSGAGFNGGPGNSPQLPWVGASAFRPWNTTFNSGASQMFQPFTVLNDGNVNMLNVRLSKAFDRQQGFVTRVERPQELFAPGLHELAWLDSVWNLYSDLDPAYTAVLRAGLATNRNILQKSRPGDVTSTRLSTNPGFRFNSNLRVASGFLLNTANFPPGDPRMGVATPIGTPSGAFVRKVFAFEDLLTLSNDPNAPALGPRALGVGTDPNDTEPYTDPGITLRFTVRESRLTNLPTTKAAPNVEALAAANQNYRWSNKNPAFMRNSVGTGFVAWSSNRYDLANSPAWLPKSKTDLDFAQQEPWRIYVSSLQGSVPGGFATNSPIRDLLQFSPSGGGRWFNQTVIVPAPATPLNSLFTLTAGETIDTSLGEASARFSNPSFPSAGFFDQSTPATDPARGETTTRYMAFVGEATKSDASGTSSQINQIFASVLNFGPTGAVAVANTVALPFDTTSRKSKPSLIQSGAAATVYYTSSSGGVGEVYTSTFNGGSFGQPRALGLGNMFENLGAPSVSLRRYSTTGQFRTMVSFTGKMRGRTHSEAFLAQLTTSASGNPSGNNAFSIFPRTFDRIEFDAASGVFWAPGLRWRLNDTDIANFDIRRDPLNAASSILDLTTQQVDREQGIMSYVTNLGGRVLVDTTTGAIRFSGGIVPRNLSLYVVAYNPTVLRVSSGTGANYRNSSIAFDDRFLGIFQSAADPTQNLLNDLNYWRNALNGAAVPADLVRHDRYMLIHNRTSGDGSQATRPYLKTMRFGVQLPFPVALNSTGQTVGPVTVTISGAPTGAFYQVDPANGRIYFTAEAEDRLVNVSYTAVDGNGATFGPVNLTNLRVALIEEKAEEVVPIEQVGNESDLTVALDPLAAAFNGQSPFGGRRPNIFWLFWTSTRAGTQDVFFQTIAPKFAPQPPTP